MRLLPENVLCSQDAVISKQRPSNVLAEQERIGSTELPSILGLMHFDLAKYHEVTSITFECIVFAR